MFAAIFKLFGCSPQSNKDGKKLSKDTLNEQISKSIEDFKNRPIYKNMTADIIDKTTDDNLLQTIFDNLSQKFTKDDDEYETVLTFSKPQQAIYVIWCLEAEVNNGGFNQYYYNSSGQFAKLTPSALKLVGANKFADLVTRANKIYDTEHEKITKNLDGTIEGFSKSYEDNPLNELDTEFFALYKAENLQELQVSFIRKEKSEFIDK